MRNFFKFFSWFFLFPYCAEFLPELQEKQRLTRCHRVFQVRHQQAQTRDYVYRLHA